MLQGPSCFRKLPNISCKKKKKKTITKNGLSQKTSDREVKENVERLMQFWAVSGHFLAVGTAGF